MQYPDLCAIAAKPSDIVSVYAHHGAMVLRSFLPAEELAILQQVASLAFGIGDSIVANLPMGRVPSDVSDGLAHGYLSWKIMTAWLACTAPDLLGDLASVTNRVQAIAASAYRDPDTRFLDGFSVIRRHRRMPRSGEVTAAAWHRDFSFVGPAGIDQSVNFWFPLVEVGIDAPSLEIVVGSHRYMREIPDETPGITNIAEEWLATHLSDYVRWTPSCRPGDVVMFDHQTIHRTQQLGRTAAIDRMNFEMRWRLSAGFDALAV